MLHLHIVNFRNIFDMDVQAVVNPVNCVGISGAGLAKAFKHRFPSNYRAYAQHCDEGKLSMGGIFVYKTHVRIPQYIVNLPTKLTPQQASSLEGIKDSLRATSMWIRNEWIQSIAFPALGCGLGGLEFRDVEPLIVDAVTRGSNNHNVTAYIIRPKP